MLQNGSLSPCGLAVQFILAPSYTAPLCGLVEPPLLEMGAAIYRHSGFQASCNSTGNAVSSMVELFPGLGDVALIFPLWTLDNNSGQATMLLCYCGPDCGNVPILLVTAPSRSRAEL